MLLNSRASAIISLLLVLIISFVLLGVSGSIMHNYQQYGSIFFRERQLSIFNIVLSIAGILISLFGFLAVLARRIACSKITIFACLLLALCAFGSLITAVAVNFLDVDYVHARFFDNMKNYKTDADARRSVDLVQRKYGCCGGSMWLDWATVPLITNTPDTRYTTTTQPTGTTTQTPNPYNILNFWENLGLLDIASIVNGAAQPQSKTTTTGSPATSSDAYIGRETTTTTKQPGRFSPESTSTAGYEDDDSFNFFAIKPSKEHHRKKRDASAQSSTTTTTTEKPKRPHHEPKDPHEAPQEFYQNVAYDASPKHQRHERQASSSYGNLYGLPISYTVPLPQSCCTLDTPSIFNSLDAYCISNANNVENTFHRSGCAERITKVAMGQALSIAVLNGFLIVFALLTIALLQRTHIVVVSSSKTYRASSINDPQGPYGANHKTTVEKVNKTSVINPNPDHSIYQ